MIPESFPSSFAALIPESARWPEDYDGRPCNDCRTITHPWGGVGEYYMVDNAVWAAAGAPREHPFFLCVGCLEKRLGRELVPADFTDVPCNKPNARDSGRLAARKGQLHGAYDQVAGDGVAVGRPGHANDLERVVGAAVDPVAGLPVGLRRRVRAEVVPVDVEQPEPEHLATLAASPFAPPAAVLEQLPARSIEPVRFTVQLFYGRFELKKGRGVIVHGRSVAHSFDNRRDPTSFCGKRWRNPDIGYVYWEVIANVDRDEALERITCIACQVELR